MSDTTMHMTFDTSQGIKVIEDFQAKVLKSLSLESAFDFLDKHQNDLRDDNVTFGELLVAFAREVVDVPFGDTPADAFKFKMDQEVYFIHYAPKRLERGYVIAIQYRDEHKNPYYGITYGSDSIMVDEELVFATRDAGLRALIREFKQ